MRERERERERVLNEDFGFITIAHSWKPEDNFVGSHLVIIVF